MRLVQIQSGISINVDLIEAVEEKDATTCKVYVGTRVYEATYPYSTFMQMLNSEKIISKGLTQSEQVTRTMNKLEGVLEKATHFAG